MQVFRHVPERFPLRIPKEMAKIMHILQLETPQDFRPILAEHARYNQTQPVEDVFRPVRSVVSDETPGAPPS